MASKDDVIIAAFGGSSVLVQTLMGMIEFKTEWSVVAGYEVFVSEIT